MSWGLVAVAGATVVGGAMSAGAASDAADAQAQSAREANQLSKEQFDAMRADLEPYRDYGAGSTNLLARYLGLPVAGMNYGGGPSPGSDPFEGKQLVDTSSGVPRANADLYANNDKYRAAWDEGLLSHNNQFGEGYSRYSDSSVIDQYLRNKLAVAPEVRTSLDAQAQAEAEADPRYGSLLKNFTGEDLENEPGYQFGLQQGQQQLDRRAAAGGNYFSGAALKGAARFGNDYASTKFGDAFNRDSANKTRIYNFLSGGASLGQNAAAQTGNAGQVMAQQVGANTMGAANAAGAAGIAGANAISGGLNNMAGMYQQNQLINRVTSGNTGWGPSQSANAYALDSSFDQYLAR
jgi:hypothetical protein